MESVQVTTYVLGAIFVISFVAKMAKYAMMPIHLRWELYPLAGKTERPWGGSYLEDPEWWTKPRQARNLAGEIRFMGKEILYFKEYYHRNRSLWFAVYPFHMGIFLFVSFFALLVIGALTMVGEVAVSGESANAWGKLVYYLTLVTGITAIVLGTLGCLALLVRKLVDRGMRPYTRRIEYFNILFVLGVFLTGLFSWVLADSTFSTAREFTKSLITFDSMASTDAIVAVHIILIGLFLAYLPFTNMMHFFAKHFTYNAVRWDDAPHLRGSEVEQKLEPLGELPISWSAPHIRGIHRWSDIAKGATQYPDRKEGTRHASKNDQAQ